MQLENVRAIITGAASGLGRYFALQLAGVGAVVAAGDIDMAGLDSLKSESTTLPGRLITKKLNVTEEASVITFVNEISKEFDGVNLLVNSAGILRDGLLVKQESTWIKKLPTAQWRQVLDVNLTGPYLMTREVVADVIKRGIKESVIVNVSSIVTRHGNPGQSNYAASKGGLDVSTRTWARELAADNIRVAGIAPGLIDTPLLGRISDEAKKLLEAEIPLGRIGTPHDVWLALKFIIECDYFTGRMIEVDGGSTS